MMTNYFDTRASPSTSEDSVEVKVKPVTLSLSSSMSAAANRTRNKRKSAEPRKLKEVIPVIKRHRWTSDEIARVIDDVPIGTDDDDDGEALTVTAKVLKIKSVPKVISTLVGDVKKRSRMSVLPSTSATNSETWSQKKQRKLSVVKSGGKSSMKKCSTDVSEDVVVVEKIETRKSKNGLQRHLPVASRDVIYGDDHKANLACLGLPFDVRNILGPSAATLLSSSSAFERFKKVGAQTSNVETKDDRTASPPVYDDDDEDDNEEDDDDGESPSGTSYLHGGDVESESASIQNGGGGSRHKQRNYKNMTRERRIEANARERTRVHTISAAFDNLRRAVPSYSCHQKLSKLAILRIACSYILALASLNDQDYSIQQDCPTFSECVDLCTRTIQAEGKARKRKD